MQLRTFGLYLAQCKHGKLPFLGTFYVVSFTEHSILWFLTCKARGNPSSNCLIAYLAPRRELFFLYMIFHRLKYMDFSIALISLDLNRKEQGDLKHSTLNVVPVVSPPYLVILMSLLFLPHPLWGGGWLSFKVTYLEASKEKMD